MRNPAPGLGWHRPSLPVLMGVKFGGRAGGGSRAGLPEECRGPLGSDGEEQHLQTAAFPQGSPKVEAEVWALHPDKVSAAQHPPAAPLFCPAKDHLPQAKKKKRGEKIICFLSLSGKGHAAVLGTDSARVPWGCPSCGQLRFPRGGWLCCESSALFCMSKYSMKAVSALQYVSPAHRN